MAGWTILNSVGAGGVNDTADVRIVQELLNRRRTPKEGLLAVDGQYGGSTLGAITAFMKTVPLMLYPQPASAGGDPFWHPPMADPAHLIAPGSPGWESLTATDPAGDRLVWGAGRSLDFKTKVIAVAHALSVPRDFLMACMALETGRSFDPAQKGTVGGTMGLIQFTPGNAKYLGTSTEALAKMSDVDQLDYVEKHFSKYRGRLHTMADVYLTIFYPNAVGRGAGHTIFTAANDPKNYRNNKGVDTDGDGTITGGEAAGKATAMFFEGLAKDRFG